MSGARVVARLFALVVPMLLALAGVALAAGDGNPTVNPTIAATAVASGGAQVGFWLLSGLVLVGAITTIIQRNTVTAVMALVATFFGLAGLYLMLSAQFLAVIQVLVYAGAIMTLFVFVVMVLNREEAEPFVWRGWITKGLGVLAVAYLLGKTGILLFADRVPARADLPPPDFGGVADVGYALFTRYLFPFEALSLMLLVAVIGAIVVARTPKQHSEDHSGGLSHHHGDDGDEPDSAEAQHGASGGH